VRSAGLHAALFYTVNTVHNIAHAQGWDAAGAGQNGNDRNFLSWALSVIMDLLFPGKKPKDIIEEGKDDNIDPGKKKKDDNVKVKIHLNVVIV
jgi:hypothetical protein